MAGKIITLDEEDTSEILVADTDSESGSEASDFENDFEEGEEEENQQQLQQQDSADIETQAAMSGGLPTWGLPRGRNTNIHPFVGPAKGVKKSNAPSINKDSSPLSVLMMFFTEIFYLLVEQTNVYYQQHLDRQTRSSHQLPDITVPDIMTFVVLALQMRHELKDKLHDYWLKTATQSVLWRDHGTRQIFTHPAFSAFCRQFTET